MENGITTKAMLVTLSIRVWNARKFDKKVTREVAEAHDTTEKIGRYNKNLLPVEAELYRAIPTASLSARLVHYRETLPWSDEGSRILLGSNYLYYTEVMRKARVNFDKTVQAFLPTYPAARIAAKTALKNGLFNEEDYPSEAVMASRFSFSVKILPLPSGDDFRVTLNRAEVEGIREQIERDAKAALTEATRDPYRRLQEVVGKMAESLVHPKGRKFDNLLANVEEVCSLLPRLNLTADPDLEKMGQEIVTRLTAHDGEELRTSEKVRDKVAKEARRIEDDLAAFMGGGQ